MLMRKTVVRSAVGALALLAAVTCPAPARADTPADFITDARLLYRIAACGGDEPVDARYDAKMIDAHCKELREKIDEYKKKWVEVAKPFLASVVPANLPTTVVYPFGGGDLLTALATFPAATEITTLSLEKSGDARTIGTIAKGKLKDELETNRKDVIRLFKVAHSKTENLSIVSTGALPGELIFVLVGLVVHDYEPLTLRYFKLLPDGKIEYLTEETLAQIAAAKDKKSKAKLGKDLWNNMEISFRLKGQPAAPIKIYRHIAANLDDKHLKADPAPIKHLEAKGKVTAMTKAASYLLAWEDFSTVRNYLLANMEWMISDSTGILPRWAKPAGFEQITYGTFEKAPEFASPGHAETEEWKKLWKTNPHQELAFRYGYPDGAHHSHLVITRKAK